MSAALPRATSKVLALLLLLGVAAVLGGGIGVPLWETYRENREEIEQQREHLARLTCRRQATETPR